MRAGSALRSCWQGGNTVKKQDVVQGQPPRWRVGQKVCVAWNRQRGESVSEETIAKIGRRWATLSLCGGGYRFDIADGSVDGGGYMSPGTVYVSKAEYLRQERAMKVFSLVKGHLSAWGCIMTEEQAEQIAAIMEIEIPPRIKEEA